MDSLDLKCQIADMANDLDGINGFVATLKKSQVTGNESVELNNHAFAITRYLNEKYDSNTLSTVEGLEGFASKLKEFINDIHLKLTEDSRKKPKINKTGYNSRQVFGDYANAAWLDAQVFREGKVMVNSVVKGLNGRDLNAISHDMARLETEYVKDFGEQEKIALKVFQVGMPLFKQVSKCRDEESARELLRSFKNIPTQTPFKKEYLDLSTEAVELPALTREQIVEIKPIMEKLIYPWTKLTDRQLRQAMVCVSWDDIYDRDNVWTESNIKLGHALIETVEWEYNTENMDFVTDAMEAAIAKIAVMFERWIFASIK